MGNKIYSIGYLWFLDKKRYLNLDTKEGVDRYVEAYQNTRFYLSDYPEQEKLREEYFALKRASYNFTVNNNETYWFESKFLTRR